uniref:Putative secreted protein n=1 Tax=Panstrongylus lignarius TaxID=156445 RepID=A0A224XZZ8_9HEMI
MNLNYLMKTFFFHCLLHFYLETLVLTCYGIVILKSQKNQMEILNFSFHHHQPNSLILLGHLIVPCRGRQIYHVHCCLH